MTAQTSMYQRMAIARLQELAATEGESQDEAARAYVDRLADMELERRLVMRHNRPGWHPSSPGFGDGTGRSSVRADPLAVAYDKGLIVDSYWHNRAQRSLGRLPERQLVALMIRTVKRDYRMRGKWAATYDDIASDVCSYAQELGWPPGVVALGWYANGRSIREAALDARARLARWSKAGLV